MESQKELHPKWTPAFYTLLSRLKALSTFYLLFPYNRVFPKLYEIEQFKEAWIQVNLKIPSVIYNLRDEWYFFVWLNSAELKYVSIFV